MSSYALFGPQAEDIQFTVKTEERKGRMFENERQKKHNLDFFSSKTITWTDELLQ